MLRFPSLRTRTAPARRPLLARLRRDTRGATAIEFALVAFPFLGMLFGIISVGLFFFTTFSMDNAIEQASRVIRTGQAQTSGMTSAQFKAKVCEYVPAHIDCQAKVFVNVRSYTSSQLLNAGVTGVARPACLNGGGALNTTSDFSMGTENAVVLIWLCYEYTMAKFPWVDLSNMSNGSMLIQATTTFRTEPYR